MLSPRVACRCGILALAACAASSPLRADLRREVEPNDSPPVAQPVVPAASVGGTIGAPGDLDIYAVGLQAGQTVVADILARGFRAGAQPGSSLSAVLTILDRDGSTVLAQSQSPGSFDDPARAILAEDAYTATDPVDPYIQVVLPADGVYTIRIRELRSFVGTSNTFYQMSVTLGASGDDGSFATGDAVVVPRAVSGVVSPAADVDHYRLHLAGAATVRADLDAREGLVSLLQGTLALNGATGILVQDSSSPDPHLISAQPSG